MCIEVLKPQTLLVYILCSVHLINITIYLTVQGFYTTFEERYEIRMLYIFTLGWFNILNIMLDFIYIWFTRYTKIKEGVYFIRMKFIFFLIKNILPFYFTLWHFYILNSGHDFVVFFILFKKWFSLFHVSDFVEFIKALLQSFYDYFLKKSIWTMFELDMLLGQNRSVIFFFNF